MEIYTELNLYWKKAATLEKQGNSATYDSKITLASWLISMCIRE